MDRDMAAEKGIVADADVAAEHHVVGQASRCCRPGNRGRHATPTIRKQRSPTLVMPPPASVPVFMVTPSRNSQRAPMTSWVATAAIVNRLRRRAERGKRINDGAFADRRHAGDVDVGDETHAGFELDLRPDQAIRTDLNAVADARAIGDARGRINCHLGLGDDRADFGLGDERVVDLGLGPIPPHVAAVRDLVDVIFDVSPGTAGLRNLALSMVRKYIERRRSPRLICRRHSTPAVCAMPSITSTPGITGLSGK